MSREVISRLVSELSSSGMGLVFNWGKGANGLGKMSISSRVGAKGSRSVSHFPRMS